MKRKRQGHLPSHRNVAHAAWTTVVTRSDGSTRCLFERRMLESERIDTLFQQACDDGPQDHQCPTFAAAALRSSGCSPSSRTSCCGIERGSETGSGINWDSAPNGHARKSDFMMDLKVLRSEPARPRSPRLAAVDVDGRAVRAAGQPERISRSRARRLCWGPSAE